MGVAPNGLSWLPLRIAGSIGVIAFFVLGLFASLIFTIGFVVALALAVAGFAGTTRMGNDHTERI